MAVPRAAWSSLSSASSRESNIEYGPEKKRRDLDMSASKATRGKRESFMCSKAILLIIDTSASVMRPPPC
jgi:hypothetical protein